MFLGGARAHKDSLARFLPQEVEGWQAVAKDEPYNTDTIFNYIDGAGEVYRAYNFRSLLARRYSRSGQPEIVADFFDMGAAADAFGVFTHGLEGERLSIGQGAVSTKGQISFWKDRYFVSLYAETETPEVRRALLALGEAIAKSIPGEGKVPGLLSLFPEGFDVRNARYFHNHLILNYHYFVSTGNILLLDDKTEAALVSSGSKSEKINLLIVRYSSAGAAEKAKESFSTGYLPGAAEAGLGQTEDKKWTSVESRGVFLVVVFHAPTRGEAEDVMKKVADKLAARPS
jgi:hypothetical protein